MTKTAPAKKAAETEAVAEKAAPKPAKTPKEQRAETNRRFEEADDKARAALAEEMQVGLQVRGY